MPIRARIALGKEQLERRLDEVLSKLGVARVGESESGDGGALLFCDVREAVTADSTAGGPKICVWERRRPDQTGNPFVDRSVRNVVGMGPRSDPEVVASTIQALAHQRGLNVEDLLGREAVIETSSATESAEKGYQLERLRRFGLAHGFPKHAMTALDMAFDELFTNAIYNAPSEGGFRLNAHRSRHEAVHSPRPITTTVATNGRLAAVAVRDLYGSLPPEEIVDNLHRCYRFEGASAEEKDGGAGLGFFLLLQESTRLVINIDPGVSTEIIVIRRIDETRREFRESAPTLNLFVKTNEGQRVDGRRHRRERVDWRTELSGAEGTSLARVLDVSPLGAFVSLDGIPCELEAGALINLAMVMEEGSEPICITATIRWRGRSYDHRCEGIGVEFSHEVPAVLLALH